MPSTQLAQSGVLDLILQAGGMAKFILLLLLSASVFSWAIIFTKWRSLKKALQEDTEFLNIFWHGKSIEDIFAQSDQFARSPVASVFKAGFKELKKLSANDIKPVDDGAVANIQRSLFRSSNAEVAQLEKNVSWLATTASASPFVGLFGTVWGIMNSFQSIGATGAANLAVVAPGISEALITTAAGIGAAIPAVIAYNHFAGKIRRLSTDMDCFSQDFLNIIQRSALTGRKGTP
jgi:biopolymer transport protein TolQ